MLLLGRDLHRRTVRRQFDHDRAVAEPLDLTRLRVPLACHAVDGDELVAEQERRLRPDEDVADPAAVAPPPLRAEAVDLPVDDADRTLEVTRLALEPASPRDESHHQRYQDDEVDPEDCEERDEHG